MTYSFAPVADGRLQARPSTLSAAYSQISRFKDPIMAMPHFVQDWFSEREEFDRTIEPMFNAISEDLMQTKSEHLFNKKKELHRQDLKDRNVFQNVTFGQNFTAAFLNPTSYVPIFRALKAGTILGGATNFALTAGTVAAAEEVPRALVYDNYDPREGAFYVASNAVFGFGFGGVVKGAQVAITNGFDTSHRALNLHAQSIREQEIFIKKEQDLPRLSKKVRNQYAKQNDSALRARSIAVHGQAMGKQKNIDAILRGNAPAGFNPNAKAIETMQREVNSLLNIRDKINTELGARRLDKGLSKVDNPYSLAKSFYDTIDFMPTPMKTILRRTAKTTDSRNFKNALNNFHRTALLIANDSSLLYSGAQFGLTLPASVAIKNNLRKADLYSFEKGITTLWQKHYDMKETMFFPETRQKTSGKGVGLDDWIDALNIRRIAGDINNLTTEESSAIELIEQYFKRMKQEGLDSGVLGSTAFLGMRVVAKETEIDLAQVKLQTVLAKDPPTSAKALADREDQIKYWQDRVKGLQNEFGELKTNLEYLKTADFKTSGPSEPFFMREFNSEAIAKDELGPKIFRKTLLEHVRENPNGFEYNKKSGLWEAKDFSNKPAAQSNYVDAIIRGIIADPDGTTGVTRDSVHYPSRSLTIPNKDILPFINTSVRDIIRKYNIKIGSKIDFANQFGNKTFKEVSDEVTDDLITNGMSVKEANALRKNLTILYRRVTATSISDPTSLTNRSVQFLKEFTSLNYLGSAGPTALGDIPKIIMEQGFRNSAKGLVAIFDSPEFNKQFKQVKEIYGEALELSLGFVQRQILEESGSTVGSKAWDSVKQGGFILNGLGPMTVGLKGLSGVLSVHRFVDTSIRVSNGSASKFDLEYLARHGIDVITAKEIAKAPVERTQGLSKGLIVSNIEEWSNKGISLETQIKFKAAVNQSINNTILSSSPATRFTYADGSIFLPVNQATKMFPLFKEDPDFPGYVRLESGVMTLPFQFYNWSMSAATNILHTAAQGQIKNRYGGFAAMLGIGYLMAKIRTPEYVWDELTSEQKFLSAIERSGISSVYGDVTINSVRALTQAGFNDPNNDPLNLAFYGKDGYSEAATTILGSGVSTIKDFSDGVIDVYSGDYGSALKEFYLMLPYTEFFWLKEDSRAMINNVARSIDSD